MDLEEQQHHDVGDGPFVVGTVIGAMVGGAMALVFARQSGAQTRDMLREWAVTLKEEVEDGVFRARTTLQAPFVRDEDL